MKRLQALVIVFAILGAACATGAGNSIEDDPVPQVPNPTSTSSPAAALEGDPPTPSLTTTVATAAPTTTTTTVSAYARPSWLGTRVLPLGPDGENGVVQPTPAELVGRAFETVSLLPPPSNPGAFEATIQSIPVEVLSRSSWTAECPVAVDELRYLTMSIYGFDGQFNTGEMIVNAAIADDVVALFRELHDARFPIEDMVITAAEEIEDPPTGDGNRTSSFECRPAVGSNSWSQHAFGLAIDINRFQNPYIKGELVLPELSSYYLDRSLHEPGMIQEGDVVTEAFDALGWGWGGRWNSLKDWMHFSQNGQ